MHLQYTTHADLFCLLCTWEPRFFFFFLGWVSNITFITTEARQQDLNEEVLDSALVDPDKRTTVKNMHCSHGTWGKVWMLSTVDTRQWTVLPWFACITTQSVSISARKWGFHCCQMNKLQRTSLILIHDYWMAFSCLFMSFVMVSLLELELLIFWILRLIEMNFLIFLLFKKNCWSFVAMVTSDDNVSRSMTTINLTLHFSVLYYFHVCVHEFVTPTLPHAASCLILCKQSRNFSVVVFVEQPNVIKKKLEATCV